MLTCAIIEAAFLGVYVQEPDQSDIIAHGAKTRRLRGFQLMVLGQLADTLVHGTTLSSGQKRDRSLAARVNNPVLFCLRWEYPPCHRRHVPPRPPVCTRRAAENVFWSVLLSCGWLMVPGCHGERGHVVAASATEKQEGPERFLCCRAHAHVHRSPSMSKNESEHSAEEIITGRSRTHQRSCISWCLSDLTWL